MIKSIAASNLSLAWAELYTHIDSSSHVPGPVVLRIDDFPGELPPEDASLVEALNPVLASLGRATIEQTALTIFPFKQWTRRGRLGIRDFTAFYLNEFLPRAKALNRNNRRGTYFERMIRFTGLGKGGDGTPRPRTVNQLEEVIEFWRAARSHEKSPRTTAIQVAIFDPAKDNTRCIFQGFPCLQQVGLILNGVGDLEVTAFYPSQYVVDRAYGNYRGLCQLGVFLAHEIGVRFAALTCFVSHPMLGTVNKSTLQHVRQRVTELLASQEA